MTSSCFWSLHGNLSQFPSIFLFRKKTVRMAYLSRFHEYNSNGDEIHHHMSTPLLDAIRNVLQLQLMFWPCGGGLELSFDSDNLDGDAMRKSRAPPSPSYSASPLNISVIITSILILKDLVSKQRTVVVKQ